MNQKLETIQTCREEMSRLIDEEASVLSRISSLRGEIARAQIKTKYIRQRKHELNLRIGEINHDNQAKKKASLQGLIIERLKQRMDDDDFDDAVEQARRDLEES